MKAQKLLMLGVCFAFVNSSIAQIDISNEKSHFGLGINGGVTIGDYDDTYSSNMGIDIIYLYSLSSKFHVGFTTGFANYFGKEIENEFQPITEFDDLQIVPITASLRISPFKNFLGGVDIGYATTLDSEIGGGFYASPRATYLIQGKIPVFAGFRMISLDERLNAVQFGIGYLLR